MNEYYRIKDIPPRGDVGYRIEAVEYDRFSANVDDPDAVVDTNPDKIYFFAQNRPIFSAQGNIIDKTLTRFSNYQYTVQGGLDFEGVIFFPGYDYAEGEEQLLYATFHVVNLGPRPGDRNIQNVQVTEMLAFRNGVSRNFPMKNDLLVNPYTVKVYMSRYYYVFFNVYETKNDESSIVYSSGEDFRLTGYNPIVITRILLDLTDVPNVESNRVWFRIKDIVHNDKSEDDPSAIYQIIAFAFPV
jgi:hypothetical protein